jgi:hypothetical protein
MPRPKGGAQNSKRRKFMRRIGFLLLAFVTLAGILAHIPHASAQSDGNSSPIYGVKSPPDTVIGK